VADINNTFGLDASQAIRELNRLDTALDAVNASITQVQVTSAGNIDTGFGKVTEDAKKASAAARKSLEEVGKSARNAGKPVRELGLSFQDVARIVQSQVLFSAINGIKQGFFEAAEAAAEFELQIARINAIAEGGSIPQFTRDVRELAVTLGRDLDEVGEAAFEALQNDIGTTAETFKILETTAQDLALVTGGTLPQAVNSLSSVIKAYNLDIDQAQKLSGIFFGAINAGRITLAEFENSLGTITPLANQVSVGFEEVATAIATITRSGTKANVATTQLRNVFNKLIKPTEELKKAYQDLGVEGFEQLQKRAGGFKEALEEITAGKTEQEIARLFNTIRGNLGVLNVLTNEGKEYSAVLKEIRKNSEELPDAIASIEGTAAREAAKNAAELNDIFIELGAEALDVKNAFTNAFLTVIQDADDAKSAIIALTSGVVGLGVAVKTTGVAFKTALPFAAAFVAGVVLGEAIVNEYERYAESLREIQDITARLEVDRLNQFAETLQELGDAEITELANQFADVDNALNQALADAKEFNDELVDAFRAANDELAGVQNSVLETFGEGRERIIKQIGDAIKEIDKQIIEDTQKIADIARDIDDFKFERSLKELSKLEQAQKRIARAQEQISEAFIQGGTAGLSEQSREAAEETAKAALSSAKAALSAAERAKDVNLIKVAEQAVLAALQSQQAILKEQNRLRGENSVAELEKRRQALIELNAEQRRGLEEALSLRDKVNEAVEAGAPEFRVEELKAAFEKARDEALANLDEFSKSNIVKIFGLGEAASAIEETLKEGLSKVDVDWSRAIDSLQEGLKSKVFTADVEVTAIINDDSISDIVRRIAAIGEGSGSSFAGETTSRTVEGLREFVLEQTKLQNDIKVTGAEQAAAITAAAAQLREANQFSLLETGLKPEATDIVNAIGEPIYQAITQIDQASKEELIQLQSNLVAAARELEATSTGLLGDIGQGRANQLQEGVNAALDAIQTRLQQFAQEVDFNPEALNDAVETLRRLEAAAASAAVDAGAAADETEKIGSAAVSANGSVDSLNSTTGNLASAASQAASAFNRMAAAARDAAAAANAANSAGSSQFAAFGGQVKYRAAGGDARGADTVPMMLSPGEFVVNSRSAAKFLPELQAINAGNYREDGGSVGGNTSITIGDINVSSTSQLPSQTAREVGNSIKRELRRGTFRL